MQCYCDQCSICPTMLMFTGYLIYSGKFPVDRELLLSLDKQKTSLLFFIIFLYTLRPCKGSFPFFAQKMAILVFRVPTFCILYRERLSINCYIFCGTFFPPVQFSFSWQKQRQKIPSTHLSELSIENTGCLILS